MHVSFTIHRLGEWTMLLIGESILSLVVGVALQATRRFYVVFFSGFLSATCLSFVFYSTQPSDPDLHALRRSAQAGIIWMVAFSCYSCSLVAYGVSLKVLLAHYGDSRLAPESGWLHCASLGCATIFVQFMRIQHSALRINAICRQSN